MTHLRSEELKACKNWLSARQAALIKQVKGSYDLEVSHIDSVGELSAYDNHPADLATELHEREKDMGLVRRAERELEAINESLHAFEEGTYGICRVCSMPIPYQRLLSNPTADTCLEHVEEPKPTDELESDMEASHSWEADLALGPNISQEQALDEEDWTVEKGIQDMFDQL